MPFPRSKDDKVLICILLDGLGNEIVQKTSFLKDILENVRPLKTVLGYSCAAQASIITGLLPAQHGGFTVYYKSNNSLFKWLYLLHFLPSMIEKKLLKKADAITRSLFRITGYFSIWEIPWKILPKFQLYERKGFYTKYPLRPILTILDEARESGISTLSYYWNTSESRIFSETESNLLARKAGFHFLYIAKIDHLLHINGNNEDRITTELNIYEERIRRIYQVASENYQHVDLMVFSDHGMLDVTERINVMAPISKLKFRLGKDYLAFFDATMVRFWFNSKKCKRLVADTMSDIKGIRFLDDNELSALGCFFPDRRYGEMIYLADGGKIISPSFFGSQDHIRGMHGYHPQEAGYKAFVGSSNLDISSAESITDLYRIMRDNLCIT